MASAPAPRSVARRDGPSGLAGAARRSRWLGEVAGLPAEIARWELAMAQERAAMRTRHVRPVTPTSVPLRRAGRQAVAGTVGNVRWGLRTLAPWSLDPIAALQDPKSWARAASLDYLREQLGALGPVAAELAAVIEQLEGVVPAATLGPLLDRPVRVRPLPAYVVHGIVSARLGSRVSLLEPEPVAVTAFSQTHRAQIDGGRRVLVRVLRPGVAVAAADDLRLAATLVPALRTVPALRRIDPAMLIDMLAHQVGQVCDLRHDVLNTIELGLALEQAGVSTLRLARPTGGVFDSQLAVYEDVAGSQPLALALAEVRGDSAVAGVVAATLEAALGAGVFAVDPRPEYLMVDPDGALVGVGCGVLGHLTVDERRALLALMGAMVDSDAAGQVAAMVGLGVTGPRVDADRLESDLRAADQLRPVRIMTAGPRGGREAADAFGVIATRHGLRPPEQLISLLRAGLAMRSLSRTVAPGTPLASALFPLLPKLHLISTNLDQPSAAPH